MQNNSYNEDTSLIKTLSMVLARQRGVQNYPWNEDTSLIIVTPSMVLDGEGLANNYPWNEGTSLIHKALSVQVLNRIRLAVCLQLVLWVPDNNYSHYRPIWQGLCLSTLRTTSANECNSNSLLTPSYYHWTGFFSHIRSISGHSGPICVPPLLGNVRHAPCPKKWMDSFC